MPTKRLTRLISNPKFLPKNKGLPSNEIEGFVLAGGASSRMGRDKAQLPFGKATFAERAAFALNAVTNKPIYIVGNLLTSDFPPEFKSKFRFLPDILTARENRRGAILGLHTVFANSNAPWAAILACDLPFASGELFERLTDLRAAEFDAVVPVQADGELQPLCALYRSEKCLPQIEKMLQENVWSVKKLLQRINPRLVEFAKIADLPGADHFFLNVNTPADYQLALTLEASTHR